MRRLDRGPWPEEAGQPKVFHPYQRAKRDLLDRLGPYCSYCERTGDLHVEHVVPQNRKCDLAEEWTNLLWAAGIATRHKGDRNESRDGYTWPDDDVLWSPFEYLPEGIVRVNPSLPEPDHQKSERLFDLVGLGRSPESDPQAKDLRFIRRREAWQTATLFHRRLNDGCGSVELVLGAAKHSGFWSVWMTVFSDWPEVCARLREDFPGTR